MASLFCVYFYPNNINSFAEKGEEDTDKIILKQLEGIANSLSGIKENMFSLVKKPNKS